MDSTRTIYRYSYVFKDELGLVPPVRDSRAFQTEAEARKDAEDLQERGYGIVVWRELQRTIDGRWKTDFDDPLTQPLDD
jgi:hypothetical protein